MTDKFFHTSHTYSGGIKPPPASELSSPTKRLEAQDSLIRHFISYLAMNGYPGLQEDVWPDKKDRKHQAIDVVAAWRGGKIAIEHTSIDVLPNQRETTDRFMKAVGELEEEFKWRGQSHLDFMIPYDAVKKGMDRESIRNAFRSWIKEKSSQLPGGYYEGILPGIPFRVALHKYFGGLPGVSFMRGYEEDKALPERLREIMRRKFAKLLPHRAKGEKTILLLEPSHMTLVHPEKMKAAVAEAAQGLDMADADMIWIADNSLPDMPQFCCVTPNPPADPKESESGEF